MKAAQIDRYGGNDVVKINTIPQPIVSDGHLLVEVYAAGVNPVDWKIREGYLKTGAPLSFPVTLGGDFSGVVTDKGKDVSGFAKGDEVYGQAMVLSRSSGSFAEFASANIQTVSQKPKKISFEEAAALPLAGVSAVQALIEHMHLAKGQKILIHGGAGGIGSVAIQIAKHIGAYIATTASTNDLSFVKELGADEVIDFKQQSFESIIHEYDAVFDPVGGETYTKSFQVLKKGGVLVSMAEQPHKELMEQYGVKAIAQFTQVSHERLAKLTELVESGAIIIHIEKEFPLEQAGDALAYQQTGHPKGKIVIKIK